MTPQSQTLIACMLCAECRIISWIVFGLIPELDFTELYDLWVVGWEQD